MNRIEGLYDRHKSPDSFSKGYLAYLSELLPKLDEKSIGAFIEAMLEARERGSTIFFLGNGGSAATASHFANDIGVGTRSWAKPFRTLALTDNVAVITALANDHGYDEIFVRQLQVLMKPGDLVVAISASGNSPNVVKAVEYSTAHGARTVGLTGFDGGKLRKIVNISIHMETAKGEYGPVEDAHMVIDHLVGAYLGQRCLAEGSSK